jgi:hypothetical protein
MQAPYVTPEFPTCEHPLHLIALQGFHEQSDTAELGMESLRSERHQQRRRDCRLWHAQRDCAARVSLDAAIAGADSADRAGTRSQSTKTGRRTSGCIFLHHGRQCAIDTPLRLVQTRLQ